MPSQFHVANDPTPFRKIAAGMWGQPSDPSIYGFVDIDVTETLTYIEHYRARTGKRLTMTHIVAQAVADCILDQVPAP